LASALAQIWLVDDPAAEGWGGPRGLSTATAIAAVLPILAVRRQPIGALAVSFCATCLNVALTAPAEGAFQTFVADIVLVFGVGAYVSGRGSQVALAVLLGATVTFGTLVRLGQDYPSAEFLPILVWFAAAWAVGRLVFSWRLRAVELERLSRQLAAERDARAREAVTVERARIARELHDVIAHNVSVMSVQATAADRVLDGDQAIVREALRTIQETARATIDEMRWMLGMLRAVDDDGELAPQPGLDDLTTLVEQARAAGLPVDLRVEGTLPPLPAGLELSAYRIVQEALTNTIKHAGQTRAAVTVRYASQAVEIEVLDDGTGDGGSAGTGHGIVGMRERVALFGGELETGRREGGGWMLRARLPHAAA
jgi:signal transduction histidine kinase